GLAVGGAAVREPRGAAPFAPERLDDPQSGDALLEVAVDDADPLAGELVGAHALLAEEVRADDQRREGGEDDQGQLDVDGEQGGGGPHTGQDAAADAFVDALPDQDRDEQTGDGVHPDEGEGDEQRAAEAVQQPAQAVGALGADGQVLVDVGQVGGRRQRGDLG